MTEISNSGFENQHYVTPRSATVIVDITPHGIHQEQRLALWQIAMFEQNAREQFEQCKRTLADAADELVDSLG